MLISKFIAANFNIGNNALYDFVNITILVYSLVLPPLVVLFIKRLTQNGMVSRYMKNFKRRKAFALHLNFSFLAAAVISGILYPFAGVFWTDLIIIPIVSTINVFYVLYIYLYFDIASLSKDVVFYYSGAFSNFKDIDNQIVIDSHDPTGLETFQNYLKVLEKDKLYLQPDFSMSSFAAHVNIPKHALSSIINEYSDARLADIVKQKRVAYLQELLNSEDYKHFSIEGLAEISGYINKSSMYRHFKEVTGQTPAEYKKMLEI